MLNNQTILFIFLLFISLSSNSFGQESYDFKPAFNDTLKARLVYNDFFHSEDSILNQIKDKEFKRFYSSRINDITRRLEFNKYLFDEFYYEKCNQILQEILQNQDSLNGRFIHVFIGRSLVPNAYCYGNGVLIVNLGLIKFFENENQLAFVIAHELGHQLKSHTNNKMKEEIAYKSSKETKSEIKKIDNLSDFETFVLNRSLNRRSKSRDDEKEADSMAIELLKGTKYDSNAGIRSLEILDSLDRKLEADTIDYIKSLEQTDFQFKTRWLNRGDGIAIQQKMDKWLIDSLKTHPDCKDRIALIKRQFSLKRNDSCVDPIFLNFIKSVNFELIRNELESKSFAFALSDALLLENEFDSNLYLKTVISICLSELYLAAKNHYLRDYVSFPDEDYGFNYYRTHLLIENVRLSELKKMALSYYNAEIAPRFDLIKQQHKDVFYAQLLYHKILESDNLEEYRIAYQNEYPNSFYPSKLNLKSNKK